MRLLEGSWRSGRYGGGGSAAADDGGVSVDAAGNHAARLTIEEPGEHDGGHGHHPGSFHHRLSVLEATMRLTQAMKQEQALLSLESHDCANSIPDLSKMIGAAQALAAQCEDMKLKYYAEMSKRKKLDNIIQETKGNTRVFYWCHPLSKAETSSGHICVVEFYGAKDGDIGIMNGETTKKAFKFDRVYTPKDDKGKFMEDFLKRKAPPHEDNDAPSHEQNDAPSQEQNDATMAEN